MIVGIYQMHIKEINIKNRIYRFFDLLYYMWSWNINRNFELVLSRINLKNGKTWKEKYDLIVDDYMLNKALDKIKEIIGIESWW